MNIQSAVEATIEIVMHVISVKKLGIPQSSRDVFEILYKNEIRNEKKLDNIKNMVGFMDIAVHNYQKFSLVVLQKVIENNFGDFNIFINCVNKNI